MLLSIIIPMFNSSNYLDDLFQSLEGNYNPQVEIILVDDGSMDDTLIRCKNASFDKPWMKVYHNSNHGVSYSRNYGLKKASGDYVMFVDSDDIFEKDWYPKVLDSVSLNTNSDLIVFSKDIQTCNPDKNEMAKAIIGLDNSFSKGYLSTPWSKLFKRTVLIENEILFSENIIHGEDALFNLRVVLASKRISIIQKSIYRYRINASSVTHNYDCRFLDSNQNYLIELFNILNEHFCESDSIVFDCMNYSFIKSIYIFVGKISRLKFSSERRTAVHDFYSRDFYKTCLKQCKVNGNMSKKHSVIYHIVKLGYMKELVTLIVWLRRKDNQQKEKWIIV